jgi:hypothetical protein
MGRQPQKLYHYAVEKRWSPELIMRLLEIHRERAALEKAA